MSNSYRIGIDIGGTFTDFALLDEAGNVTLWKEDTTPDDPLRAVVTGLEAISAELDCGVEDLLAETKLFVHGTTIATNLLIQRRGPKTGLLCTAGFRDVLHYRDGFKPARFDIHYPHPEPLVPRWLRLGVPERYDAEGNELVPLDEEAVRAAAAKFRAAKVTAVAVAFLWSVINPAHEVRAAEILAEEMPEAHVICSHEVLGELREWERTSAAVLSAYIRPSISSYLRRLEDRLKQWKSPKPPLIMQVNGGCGRVRDILRQPVSVLASGPTAAPAAALHEGRLLDAANLITVDIGGTSCDVSIIRDGQPTYSRTLRVDEQPLGVPGVEVHSIGAGGGSIAWVDGGGALRVGPRSAGSVPGPACYDLGGEDPTVTDANLVLGIFSSDAFLEGRRRLRHDLAEQALAGAVGEQLGLSAIEAAAGVRTVVEANMVGAINMLSTERGIDPRGFVLVGGGGGGGAHGVELARSLGIKKVLIPAASGTLCAFGMTVTEVRHDHAFALHQLSDALDTTQLKEAFERLENEAIERLEADGFNRDEIYLDRLVDARYPGQVHELTVEVPAGLEDEGFAEALASQFHREHERQYAYAREDLTVEFLHWRVRATGQTERQNQVMTGSAAPSRAITTGNREIRLGADRLYEADVYRSRDLIAGNTVDGPALIESPTTTILVGPEDRLTVMPGGSMMIDVAVAERQPTAGSAR